MVFLLFLASALGTFPLGKFFKFPKEVALGILLLIVFPSPCLFFLFSINWHPFRKRPHCYFSALFLICELLTKLHYFLISKSYSYTCINFISFLNSFSNSLIKKSFLETNFVSNLDRSINTLLPMSIPIGSVLFRLS